MLVLKNSCYVFQNRTPKMKKVTKIGESLTGFLVKAIFEVSHIKGFKNNLVIFSHKNSENRDHFSIKTEKLQTKS